MENGLPLLSCLLQHTLRTLCSSSDSSSSTEWVYAVFWRILPRNFPPPKWEFGETAMDCSKGNKRNWILVWEDGFCDFNECYRASCGYFNGRFGADVFFKMSHEVYNYGEGLLGKVAADNSHKWVYRDSPNEAELSNVSSWNVSFDPPRAWEVQFRSGIQTIAVIAVREGIVQLGSFNKIAQDVNLVISIQRKFSYLQSIPGVFAMQRPYLPIQHPYMLKPNFQMTENNETALSMYNMNQVTGAKRVINERSDFSSMKSINLGWNSPQNGKVGAGAGAGPSLWSGLPRMPMPTMSCSLGDLLSKLPAVISSYDSTQVADTDMCNNVNRVGATRHRVKVEECGFHVSHDGDNDQKAKIGSLNANMELQDGMGAELGSSSLSK